MPEWSVIAIYLGLVAVAMGRGGATYALGRGARGAAERRWTFDTALVRRGESVVRRFGAPAVSLCFLTIGLQTAVLLAAGTLKMPVARFVPALVLGALLWAGIYSTVGLAAVNVIWGDGRLWIAVAALAGVGLLVWVVRALLRGRLAAGSRDSFDDGRF